MSKVKQDRPGNFNRKLTAKEERFCYEYLLDFNASKAALRSGYSAKSAYSIGPENLTKPEIKRRIKEKQDNIAELVGFSTLRIVREHEKIAFLNGGKLRDGWFTPHELDLLTDDEKSCIQEVSTAPGKYGDSLKIKFYSKQSSLDSLADILGIKAPTKNELTGKDGSALIPSITIEIINSADKVKKE